jgi:hypothetical protein
MSRKSSHMIREGKRLKWIKRDTLTKRKAKRQTQRASRKRNRAK